MGVSLKRILEIPDEKHQSITQEVITKLETAFAMGCQDGEACLFAGVGKTTFYMFQRDNPDFVSRKEHLKQFPILKAREKIHTELGKDTHTARWYLERKARDEFGQQIDITHKVELSDEQIEARLKVLLASNPDLIELIQDPESGDYEPESSD